MKLSAANLQTPSVTRGGRQQSSEPGITGRILDSFRSQGEASELGIFQPILGIGLGTGIGAATGNIVGQAFGVPQAGTLVGAATGFAAGAYLTETKAGDVILGTAVPVAMTSLGTGAFCAAVGYGISGPGIAITMGVLGTVGGAAATIMCNQ